MSIIAPDKFFSTMNPNLGPGTGHTNDGGVYEYCVTIPGAMTVAAQDTKYRNVTIAKSLAAYPAAFFDPQGGAALDTMRGFRWHYRPNLGVAITDGGLMWEDGRYSGPLFPDGTWNDGTVFTGTDTFVEIPHISDDRVAPA